MLVFKSFDSNNLPLSELKQELWISSRQLNRQSIWIFEFFKIFEMHFDFATQCNNIQQFNWIP